MASSAMICMPLASDFKRATAMRDVRADWRRWTYGERIAAITIATFIALVAPTVALIAGA
jgi:hypothetical protein